MVCGQTRKENVLEPPPNPMSFLRSGSSDPKASGSSSVSFSSFALLTALPVAPVPKVPSPGSTWYMARVGSTASSLVELSERLVDCCAGTESQTYRRSSNVPEYCGERDSLELSAW